MAYAEDLLEVAEDLANLNWARVELRPALGRVFDHGRMTAASARKVSDLNRYFKDSPPDGPERAVASHLLTVGKALIEAQQQRNNADYNTAREWTRSEALLEVEAVFRVFKSWNAIRDEPDAQAFLVSLFGSRERGQNDPASADSLTGRKNH